MRELPTGRVTLLFTDIEGSTRLADELGPRWPIVVTDHNALLRDVFARHGGVEVDRQGDAFFVVFAQADAGATAAAEGQRALAGHSWPEGRAVRRRMGLHTGEPLLMEDMYLGLDVHKAARICSAAHGGQVLLSASTQELLAAPARDLGEFRLKDLTAPERLYQLEIEGLASKFPPPSTLTATNLPTQPVPLVGRRADLGAGLELLRSDARLVTLTGAGGPARRCSRYSSPPTSLPSSVTASTGSRSRRLPIRQRSRTPSPQPWGRRRNAAGWRDSSASGSCSAPRQLRARGRGGAAGQ